MMTTAEYLEEKGATKGFRKGILNVLKTRFNEIPSYTETMLEKVRTEESLNLLYRMAVTAETLDLFIAHLSNKVSQE